jgi:PKD repeat protein
MKKHLLSLLLLVACCFQKVQAQLYVDTAYSAQQMITDFFSGTGVQISNITYNGPLNAIGFFDAANTNLGINAGILITSGSVNNAVGPNLNGAITQANGMDGDTSLNNLIPGYYTYDASVIEFDIIPDNDTLYFKYSFGSDEYMEFAGSSFNDVFGFFISGPGINGQVNMALVPDTNVVVSINNVNCNAFSNYYQCNDLNSPTCGNCPTDPNATTIQYDGFTLGLKACSLVQPGETYHLKIAIADAGDQILDSGVFISIESLDGGGGLPCVANYNPNYNGNTVQFNYSGKYASSYLWDFGDGTFSTEKNPTHTFADLSTQSYAVKLVASNFYMSDSITYNVGLNLGLSQAFHTEMIVSPNPATEVLHIKSNSNSPLKVSLLSLSGVELKQSILQNGTGQLDLSDLTPGMYIVRGLSDRQTFSRSVIKR